MNPQMLPKLRSELLMAEIRGASDYGEPFICTTRVSSFFPGHRCSDGTVVGSHLPVGPSGGKGQSTKVTDMAVAASCAHCHDIIDGVDLQRYNFIIEKYPAAFINRLLCGLVETHALLLKRGVLIVKDGEFI